MTSIFSFSHSVFKRLVLRQELVLERVNPPMSTLDNNILALSKRKGLECRLNVNKNLNFCVRRVEKQWRKKKMLVISIFDERLQKYSDEHRQKSEFFCKMLKGVINEIRR